MSEKSGESLEANRGRFWAISDEEATVISDEDADSVSSSMDRSSYLSTGASPYLACSPASGECTLVEAAVSALR
jgi:hypothetical protein